MEYYLIGSLRNPDVVHLGNRLSDKNINVFSSWAAAGPLADDSWRDYEKSKGVTYKEALKSYAAQHVFQFDRFHLNRCDGAILLCPAGKSGHLELGYVLGKDKPGFIYLPGEPERWDVMYNFSTAVCTSFDELVSAIRDYEVDKELPF